MRRLRAIMAFIRHQEWVDEPKWEAEDERALTGFLSTLAGKKLSLILLNLTLRQNASAVEKDANSLAEACGYAKGFRGCIATIESLCSPKQNSPILDSRDGVDESAVN